MRFLCLHGKGTSARIMASQTASFRAKLNPSFEFEFVDGLMESDPAPDIPLFYTGPYYSWWEPPHTIEDQRAAHRWLDEKCEKDGPYDGVMMFSQGCALIASYLLYHQTETPSAPLPFKVAIFICGGAPLNVLEDVGIHVSREAHDWDERSRKGLFAKTTSITSWKKGQDRWAPENDLLYNPSKKIDIGNIFGLDLRKENLPKELSGQNGTGRGIALPSVHIYGTKDPRYPQSLQLAHLFDERCSRSYNHGGGHDIPRRTENSESIAELIEWSALKIYGLIK